MHPHALYQSIQQAIQALEAQGDLMLLTDHPDSVTRYLFEAALNAWDDEYGAGCRSERVDRVLNEAIQHLQTIFSHSVDQSEDLAWSYHHRFENMRGCADDDYYDHEGSLDISLEIQYFIYLNNAPYQKDTRYLDWRTKIYQRIRTDFPSI